MLRSVDQNADQQIAMTCAAEYREAFAAETEDRARLSAGRNMNRRRSVQSREMVKCGQSQKMLFRRLCLRQAGLALA
jgi:hypothetical protein